MSEAARTGEQVVIPAGTYLINANTNPIPGGAFGGVSLPSGTRLKLEADAILQALSSSTGQYSILRIEGFEDVRVEGPGIDILMNWGNKRVAVEAVNLRSRNGIIIRDGSEDIRISRVDINASGRDRGTSAQQVSADNPPTVRGIEVSRSTLHGGNVVLNIPYPEVRDVRILNNQIIRGRQREQSYRVDARGADVRGNRVQEL